MTDRTGITPLLPLDFWRYEIGYNPWHFWGIADNNIIPVTSKCNTLVYEYAWQQADQAGRAEIRQAIVTAEQILFDNMKFWPAPAYSVETHPWPRYIDQRLMRYGRSDVRGGWIPIQLREAEIQACGVQALDLLTAAAPVVYTDNDGDGISEDFTVTIASTVSEDEIAIFFVTADRVYGDDAFGLRWRIEPVNVNRSGANLIITGKRWLMVKPKLYESKSNTPIDPLDATKFAGTVDVYRRYTYMDGMNSQSDSQSALIWESRPCDWGCSSIPSSNDPASEGWIAGRSGIRHSEDGIVIPAEAVYNATTGTWESPGNCLSSCSEPDKVLVRYLAGKPLDIQGHMYKPMRTLVSRLSCAEMTHRICACDTANREWANWQFDVSRINAPEVYQISFDLLNNPLGTRRGHIFAWQQIKNLAKTVGMLA